MKESYQENRNFNILNKNPPKNTSEVVLFPWSVNRAAINVDLEVFLRTDRMSLEYLFKNTTIGSYGLHYLSLFRNDYTDFCMDASRFHSQSKWAGLSFPSHPHQHLLFFNDSHSLKWSRLHLNFPYDLRHWKI